MYNIPIVYIHIYVNNNNCNESDNTSKSRIFVRVVTAPRIWGSSLDTPHRKPMKSDIEQKRGLSSAFA